MLQRSQSSFNQAMLVRKIQVTFANRASGEFHSIEGYFQTIAHALPEEIEVKTCSAPMRGASLQSIISNMKWSAGLRNSDIVHITGHIHYAILSVWRSSAVLTINDVRFIDEARGIKRFLFWWLWLYLPCLRANRVTVISEFTKARVLALSGIKPEKVRMIPCPVAPEFMAKPKLWPSDKPQLLHIGNNSNKNLDRVIAACAGLPVKLTILGKLKAAQRDQLDFLKLEYEELNNLSKDEVVDLYAACDLVVFVSTYEGFGLPIIEAQAIGRPVITSNLAPMCKVAGRGALLVDPFDIASIRNGLISLLNDGALREQIVRDGFLNAALYSAKSVAAQYAALYKEILEST